MSVPRHCGEPMIGVEIWGVYDGMLFYRCDRCNGVAHRWPEGHGLHDKAHEVILDHGLVLLDIQPNAVLQ